MVNTAKRGGVLECKHVRYYRNGIPKVGERVWCPECGDMRRLVSWEGWYFALCDGCRYSYTRGGLITLGRHAKQHRCHRPSFRYWVWRDGWERISEKIVYALDSDPLWADTDSTEAGAGPATAEKR